MSEVAVIPGDGIGQEVIPAAKRVLAALETDLSFIAGEAGDRIAERDGHPLPADVQQLVAEVDATLFGAVGESAADVILPLRRTVGSFVNVRPARAFPGVDALQPETDLVILRENTEGVYAGHESRLTDDVTTLTRVVTKRASRRLGEFACEFVANIGEDGFVVAHKDNVMRVTDGVFRETIEAVASERGVETEAIIMDALAMHLVMDPGRFDVIVTPNLAGDVLSDLTAGLVGGLGLLPSANIGTDRGLFEPVHGSAPDIAGQGIANPTAAILSGAMLLEFLGYDAESRRVGLAVTTVLQDGPVTPDLSGEATTEEFTDAVIAQL